MSHADWVAVEAATAEEAGVLSFLMDENTTFDVLDLDVALDARAARNLIAHRDGEDGVLGTSDDGRFASIADVDAVPWVGPVALQKLRDWARAHRWVPADSDLAGVWEGVAFTWEEVHWTLDLVNGASVEVLDDEAYLSRPAAEGIVGARPIDSMAALTRVAQVGPGAMELLHRHVNRLHPRWCEDDAECGVDEVCVGPEVVVGQCLPAELIWGEGASCEAEEDCAAGLTCGGLPTEESGRCVLNDLGEVFTNGGSSSIPDGAEWGTGASVTVYAMGDRLLELVVSLDVTHPSPEQLSVVLEAPSGDRFELWSRSAPLPEQLVLPSPERLTGSVNGRWTVRVIDAVPGDAGRRGPVALSVVSDRD